MMKVGPEPCTLEEFRACFPSLPKAKAEAYFPLFLAACKEFEITSPDRLAAFTAQIGHESADLRHFKELGNYCVNYDTGRLAARLGNTPEADGDGCKYLGRSPTQLTGRANYEEAGRALGLPLVDQPELAELPEHGFRIAAWFWKSRGLNELSDKGDFRGITIRLAGGLTHYEHRVKRWLRNQRVFGLHVPQA